MLKKYTVATAGPIPCLDNIVGPLTTPTVMDHASVLKMLNKGYVIYQHNPLNLSEKVLVTKKNLMSIKFGASKKAVEQKNLNKEIQDMSKPAVKIDTPVITKPQEKKEEKKEDKKDHKNDNKGPVVNEPKKDKVSSPDDFTA